MVKGPWRTTGCRGRAGSGARAGRVPGAVLALVGLVALAWVVGMVYVVVDWSL